MKIIVAHVVVIVVLAIAVQASVPREISYQGFLTRPDGTPLDTTVSMTFNLYELSLTILWSETQPSVLVENGLFNVTLGQITPIADSVYAANGLQLGITVGGDTEMSPRIPVNTVPYANRIATVDGAKGGSISGSLEIGYNHSTTGFGGFASGVSNTVSQDYSSVAGGSGNTVNGVYGFIGAGVLNVVNSAGSVCGGGYENVENGLGGSNTIAGGYHNHIEGNSWASKIGRAHVCTPVNL